MSKLEYQVVRHGQNCWLIWQLQPQFKTPKGHGREYEEVARVIEDDGAWFVEVPKWGTDGIDHWERQPRPWALREGAIHSVTHPKQGAAA